jgi:hypothetical protein
MPFELGRTLLVKGMLERRGRQVQAGGPGATWPSPRISGQFGRIKACRELPKLGVRSRTELTALLLSAPAGAMSHLAATQPHWSCSQPGLQVRDPSERH